MNNIDGYLEELIATLERTNSILEKIAERISWVAGER